VSEYQASMVQVDRIQHIGRAIGAASTARDAMTLTRESLLGTVGRYSEFASTTLRHSENSGAESISPFADRDSSSA
jgi:hypothetical protein